MAPQAPKRSHLFKAKLNDEQYNRVCNRQWEEFQIDESARTNAGFLMRLVDHPGHIAEPERAKQLARKKP